MFFHVFMLSSDKTLVGAPGIGDAVSRHVRYGALVDRLTIVVATPRRWPYRDQRLSDHVFTYPSRSFSKLLFFVDAWKFFRRVRREASINLVVAQDPFYFGLIGAWLKFWYGAKLIIHFHGDFLDNPSWRKERWFNPFLLLISFFVVRYADGIRVVSRIIEAKLLRHGIPQEHIAVIPTPVDSAWFTSYDPRGIAMLRERYSGKRMMLSVGRLVEVKNIPFLLRIFRDVRKKIPEALLLIAGDGPEEAMLRKLVSALQLDASVEFLGLCAREELARYYQIADVVVLTSLSEGLPKVLVEAAACGRPLIATIVSGADELIQDGVNGFLIPQGDEKLFAEKLIALLHDEHLRRVMGDASRKIITERFADTTHRVVEFWRKVIAKT